jgi:ABC-type transport system involved in cytochrome c biogenesis permease component
MWPLLERELRACSRKQSTYSLRLLGGCLVISIIGSFTLFETGPHSGQELFDRLYRYLFLAVWIVVPLAAADSISSERREGTLALLLLTPIRSWQIVLAKSLSQILRVFGFGLASLPALAFPFLLGGVKWWEAVLGLLVLASSFCWALAGALWVSSHNSVWWRASVGSLLVSLLAMVVFCSVFAAAMSQSLSVSGNAMLLIAQDSLRRFMIIALASTMSLFEILGQGGFGTSITPASLLPVGCLLLGGSIAILFGGLFAAGWKLARRSGASATSGPGLVENLLCRPVFQRLYRAWSRRKLEANPIGWLEQRTWSARVTRWCTLGFLMIVYSVLLIEGFRWRTFVNVQLTIAFCVMLAMAFASAASFHRERENGMLPLLLTAPLRVSDIVRGRLLSIWVQFSLAFALTTVMWFGLNSISRRAIEFHHWLWFLSISFLTIPIVGLFYSLRRTTFLAAYSCTIVVGLVVPLMIGVASLTLAGLALRFENAQSIAGASMFFLGHALSWGDSFWFFPVFVGGVAQLVVGLIALKRLCRCLSERTFALHRP